MKIGLSVIAAVVAVLSINSCTKQETALQSHSICQDDVIIDDRMLMKMEADSLGRILQKAPIMSSWDSTQLVAIMNNATQANWTRTKYNQCMWLMHLIPDTAAISKQWMTMKAIYNNHKYQYKLTDQQCITYFQTVSVDYSGCVAQANLVFITTSVGSIAAGPLAGLLETLAISTWILRLRECETQRFEKKIAPYRIG